MSLMKIHHQPPPKNPHSMAKQALLFLLKYLFAIVTWVIHKISFFLYKKSGIVLLLIAVVAASVVAYSYGVSDSNSQGPQIYVMYKHVDGTMKLVNIETLDVAEAAINEEEFILDDNSFTIVGNKKLRIAQTNKKVPKATVRTCVEQINTLQHLFVATSVEYDVPASIIAAQYLLESNAGKSKLAKYHNYFGIKVSSVTKPFAKGHVTGHDDCCSRGKRKCSKPDKFAAFPTQEKGFSAYGAFLNQDRYKSLQSSALKGMSGYVSGKTARENADLARKYAKTPYKRWAYGLRAVGYATDPAYGTKLVNIIEKYKLYELDK